MAEASRKAGNYEAAAQHFKEGLVALTKKILQEVGLPPLLAGTAPSAP